MPREKRKAAIWALLVTASLAGLIVVGSGRLKNFDAALVDLQSYPLSARTRHLEGHVTDSQGQG